MLRLKELRTEKGLMQEDVAKAINVQNYTIGNWERERSEPSVSAIIDLADYFGCTTDYLLGRENDLGLVEINSDLSGDEQELINQYRKLSLGDKSQLLALAKRFLS